MEKTSISTWMIPARTSAQSPGQHEVAEEERLEISAMQNLADPLRADVRRRTIESLSMMSLEVDEGEGEAVEVVREEAEVEEVEAEEVVVVPSAWARAGATRVLSSCQVFFLPVLTHCNIAILCLLFGQTDATQPHEMSTSGPAAPSM